MHYGRGETKHRTSGRNKNSIKTERKHEREYKSVLLVVGKRKRAGEWKKEDRPQHFPGKLNGGGLLPEGSIMQSSRGNAGLCTTYPPYRNDYAFEANERNENKTKHRTGGRKKMQAKRPLTLLLPPFCDSRINFV